MFARSARDHIGATDPDRRARAIGGAYAAYAAEEGQPVGAQSP